MKFPFMLRSDHDEQVRLTNVIISSLQQKVSDMGVDLIRKEKEIQALIDQLAENQNSMGHIDQVRPKIEPILSGRGGWRARAMKRTRDSIPTPKDSSQALEERVKKEGGV